jgi:hypothetical protein
MFACRRDTHRVPGPVAGRRLGVLATPIVIYDLSEGGCFNLFDDTAVGQRLKLELVLPDEGVVTMLGETVHGQPGFGCAVRFVDMSDQTRAGLHSALDNLRQHVA